MAKSARQFQRHRMCSNIRSSAHIQRPHNDVLCEHNTYIPIDGHLAKMSVHFRRACRSHWLAIDAVLNSRVGSSSDVNVTVPRRAASVDFSQMNEHHLLLVMLISNLSTHSCMCRVQTNIQPFLLRTIASSPFGERERINEWFSTLRSSHPRFSSQLSYRWPNPTILIPAIRTNKHT